MVNLILIPIILLMNTLTIYNFTTVSSLKNWKIIDDIVMGGISSSSININKDGNGVFKGHVSLENNGGFSSLRHQISTVDISGFNHFQIRVKGDGKNYQFRVKSSINESHSYKFKFSTNKEWQTIKIPFSDLQPTFRGRDLRMPNFPGLELQETAFLIANKTEEDFILEIDYIKACK